MDVGYLSGLMGENTKVNTLKTKRMAKAVSLGQMEGSTMVAGLTENKKVKAFIPSKTAKANEVFGKKAKGFNGFEIINIYSVLVTCRILK